MVHPNWPTLLIEIVGDIVEKFIVDIMANIRADIAPVCAARREGAAKNPAHPTEKVSEDAAATSKTIEADVESGDVKAPAAAAAPAVVEHKELSWAQKASKMAMHGMNVDIHHRLVRDEHLRAIHDRAEIFEPKVEYTFKYLQVCRPLPVPSPCPAFNLPAHVCPRTNEILQSVAPRLQ